MKHNEIISLVDHYRKWLGEEITTHEVGDFIVVSTPFLDKNNDYIKVYIKQSDSNAYTISDDGNTIAELEISGCDITTQKRKEILSQLLNGHGISLNEKTKALETISSASEFNIKKHLLLQGILAINDMFNLATPQIISLFREDVEKWFSSIDIPYVPNVTIQGKGFQHTMDFILPKTNLKKERDIKLVNNPSTDNIKNVIFTYLDAFERFKTTDFLILMNDENKEIIPKIKDSLDKYTPGISPIYWSQRNNHTNIFLS